MVFFQRGNPCFWSKNANSFFYLVLVKTRLEIRFNNVLDRKETFFEYKNKIFQSPKNRNFPKGAMLLVKKCQIFLYVDLVKIRVEKMLNNFVEKEETFF